MERSFWRSCCWLCAIPGGSPDADLAEGRRPNGLGAETAVISQQPRNEEREALLPDQRTRTRPARRVEVARDRSEEATVLCFSPKRLRRGQVDLFPRQWCCSSPESTTGSEQDNKPEAGLRQRLWKVVFFTTCFPLCYPCYVTRSLRRRDHRSFTKYGEHYGSVESIFDRTPDFEMINRTVRRQVSGSKMSRKRREEENAAEAPGEDEGTEDVIQVNVIILHSEWSGLLQQHLSERMPNAAESQMGSSASLVLSAQGSDVADGAANTAVRFRRMGAIATPARKRAAHDKYLSVPLAETRRRLSLRSSLGSSSSGGRSPRVPSTPELLPTLKEAAEEVSSNGDAAGWLRIRRTPKISVNKVDKHHELSDLKEEDEAEDAADARHVFSDQMSEADDVFVDCVEECVEEDRETRNSLLDSPSGARRSSKDGWRSRWRKSVRPPSSVASKRASRKESLGRRDQFASIEANSEDEEVQLRTEAAKAEAESEEKDPLQRARRRSSILLRWRRASSRARSVEETADAEGDADEAIAAAAAAVRTKGRRSSATWVRSKYYSFYARERKRRRDGHDNEEDNAVKMKALGKRTELVNDLGHQLSFDIYDEASVSEWKGCDLRLAHEIPNLDLMVMAVRRNNSAELNALLSSPTGMLTYLSRFWSGFYPILIVEIVGAEEEEESDEFAEQLDRLLQHFGDAHRISVRESSVAESVDFVSECLARLFLHARLYQCSRFFGKRAMAGRQPGGRCPGGCDLANASNRRNNGQGKLVRGKAFVRGKRRKPSVYEKAKLADQ